MAACVAPQPAVPLASRWLPIGDHADLSAATTLRVFQALLRTAEATPALPELAVALRAQLRDRYAAARATLPIGTVLPSDIAAELSTADIERLADSETSLTFLPARTLVLFEALACYQAWRLFASTTELGDARLAEVLRVVLASEPLAGRPCVDWLWPEGAPRDAAFDAQLFVADQLPAGTVLPPECRGSRIVARVFEPAPAMAAASSTARLCRLSEQPELAEPLGRLAMLRDLMHLYGHAIANHAEERRAVAAVFSQVVQQQQHGATALEAAGVRVQFRTATPVPADAGPELRFRLALHEVLREEIDAIQRAKADDNLTLHGLRSHRRLSAAITAVVASSPDVPAHPEGWVPSAKSVRQPLAQAMTVVIGYEPGPGGAEPVAVALRVSELRVPARETDVEAADLPTA